MTRSTAIDCTKSLDGAQICSIIESCSQHGVTALKFGDLSLEFGPKANPALPGAREPEPPQPSDAEISETQSTEVQRELAAQNVRLRDEELAEKMLTDPAEYERMLQEGDLDADNEHGDGDDE